MLVFLRGAAEPVRPHEGHTVILHGHRLSPIGIPYIKLSVAGWNDRAALVKVCHLREVTFGSHDKQRPD